MADSSGYGWPFGVMRIGGGPWIVICSPTAAAAVCTLRSWFRPDAGRVSVECGGLSGGIVVLGLTYDCPLLRPIGVGASAVRVLRQAQSLKNF